MSGNTTVDVGSVKAKSTDTGQGISELDFTVRVQEFAKDADLVATVATVVNLNSELDDLIYHFAEVVEKSLSRYATDDETVIRWIISGYNAIKAMQSMRDQTLPSLEKFAAATSIFFDEDDYKDIGGKGSHGGDVHRALMGGRKQGKALRRRISRSIRPKKTR